MLWTVLCSVLWTVLWAVRWSVEAPHATSTGFAQPNRKGADSPGRSRRYDLHVDAPAKTLTILLYSSDADCRAQVMAALGRRPAAELPRVEYVEVATEPMVTRLMGAGGIDLVILDGEATPAGGLGMCRAMKDEVFRCPPVLVLTGRPQDAWLATWSRADGVVPHPIDPLVLADVAATLLRGRVAVSPV